MQFQNLSNFLFYKIDTYTLTYLYTYNFTLSKKNKNIINFNIFQNSIYFGFFFKLNYKKSFVHYV